MTHYTKTNSRFNLGNISEDVLKDGRRFYENGISTPNAPAPMDETVWGRVPRNQLQVTNAFSNNPDDRKFQERFVMEVIYELPGDTKWIEKAGI